MPSIEQIIDNDLSTAFKSSKVTKPTTDQATPVSARKAVTHHGNQGFLSLSGFDSDELQRYVEVNCTTMALPTVIGNKLILEEMFSRAVGQNQGKGCLLVSEKQMYHNLLASTFPQYHFILPKLLSPSLSITEQIEHKSAAYLHLLETFHFDSQQDDDIEFENRGWKLRKSTEAGDVEGTVILLAAEELKAGMLWLQTPQEVNPGAMTLIELHPSPVDTDPDVAHKFAGAFGSLDGFVYEHFCKGRYSESLGLDYGAPVVPVWAFTAENEATTSHPDTQSNINNNSSSASSPSVKQTQPLLQ